MAPWLVTLLGLTGFFSFFIFLFLFCDHHINEDHSTWSFIKSWRLKRWFNKNYRAADMAFYRYGWDLNTSGYQSSWCPGASYTLSLYENEKNKNIKTILVMNNKPSSINIPDTKTLKKIVDKLAKSSDPARDIFDLMVSETSILNKANKTLF